MGDTQPGEPAKKNRGGRPPKLLPKVQEQLISVLLGSITATYEEACSVVGISQATFCRWRAQGEQDIAANRKSRYREFCEALMKALDQRRLAREQRMVQFSKPKEGQAPTSVNLQALAWIMEKSDPGRYAPKVVYYVQQELTAAADALEKEFANEPEILERALNALAGRYSGTTSRTIEGSSRRGDVGEVDSGDEAVQPTPRLPETGLLPSAGS